MSDPLDSLREQLQVSVNFRRTLQPGWPYPYLCTEDFVLRHGAAFRRSVRRPPVDPTPRACFHNAYRLATRRNSRWIYCEGYGVSSVGLAVPHAWVAHRDAPGEAVEVAWDDPPESTAYMGIPFRAEYVREIFFSSVKTQYGVLDAWWQDHPLLTGATALEDVLWKPVR